MDFLIIDGEEEVMTLWVQTLQSIHMNFFRLTHRVPMAQVKDLPEAMQCQVVGVPRAWIRLFWRLARVVVLYHNQNPPPPQA